jgi:hypothetical protein
MTQGHTTLGLFVEKIMDDFFDSVPDQSHSFRSEEKIIKEILKKADKPDAFKPLTFERKRTDDIYELNLSWFVNRYPSFPIWLGYRKVAFQRDTFGNMHKRFTQTPCYKAWEEVLETKPESDSRGVGCVFMWPKFGVCCIHQYSPSFINSGDGFMLVKKLPSIEERFIIEPLSQLLDKLDWKLPE